MYTVTQCAVWNENKIRRVSTTVAVVAVVAVVIVVIRTIIFICGGGGGKTSTVYVASEILYSTECVHLHAITVSGGSIRAYEVKEVMRFPEGVDNLIIQEWQTTCSADVILRVLSIF